MSLDTGTSLGPYRIDAAVGGGRAPFRRHPGELVWHFEPAPGGQRFLVLHLNDEPEATPLHVLTDWHPGLR